jgi:Protein of unknown function (DUF2958)
MSILNEQIRRKLLENGRQQAARHAAGRPLVDLRPVTRLVREDGSCEWFLSEVLPRNPDMAFAVCNYGDGNRVAGYMSISKILASGISPGPAIIRDSSFEAKKTIIEYTIDAMEVD